MTPHELNMHIEEFYAAKDDAEKERALLTYIGAKLPLLKKFPTFEEAFGFKLGEDEPTAKKPKEPQPEEEMKAMVMALNAKLGGTVY
ncbi:hypothetical protein A7975_10785 [Bacillus sp. FJAT-26390]|nr:hypothetical protein A7975_10785 [Bacillus sp. FJAT-26390]